MSASTTAVRETIESIYPLSPMQEGMLLQALMEPSAGLYVQQQVLEIDGSLDRLAFRRALDLAVARHGALRTGFVWKDRARPLQVVYRSAGLEWAERDLEAPGEAEVATALSTWLAEDRRRGFDVGRPPLLRATLLRAGRERHLALISNHHTVIDGWSALVLMREVLEAYEALSGGRAPELPPPRQFGEYIAWLRRQDPARDEAFWRSALNGVRAPTPVLEPAARPPAGSARPPLRSHRADLDGAVVAAIRELGSRRSLSLNTLCQAAWAQVLSDRTGRADVLFGTVVSGRPADLEHVDTMVGMFVNTIPVRVHVPGATRLGPWLPELQEAFLAYREHEHSSLAQVQGWSEVRRGVPLFESVLAVQNLAGGQDELTVAGLRVRPALLEESTGLPLTVLAFPRPEGLTLGVDYDPQRLDAGAAALFLEDFRARLTALPGAAHATAGQVGALREAEADDDEDEDAAGPLRRLARLPVERRAGWLDKLARAIAEEGPAPAVVRVPGPREARLAGWRAALAGAQAFALPPDHSRTVEAGSGPEVAVRHDLPAALAGRVRDVASRLGTGVEPVLVAGWLALLLRHTHEDEVLVPYAGSQEAAADGAGQPGLLPLRLARDERLTFEQLVSRCSEVVADARGRGGLTRAELEGALGGDGVGLVLLLRQDGDAVGVELRHGRGRRSDGMSRLGDRLELLLDAATATPAALLRDLPCADLGERAQVLRWGQGPPAPYPSASLAEVFEARVARRPQAAALVHRERRLSYRELNEAANRLARRLRGLGVGPEVTVGIALERTPEMVVAVLAVLKAGGAYVPLDLAHPVPRLAFMAQDAGLRLVLVQAHLRERLAGLSCPLLEVDAAGEESGDLPPLAGPRSLAYVLYTSGSTGEPKGVQVEQRSVVNHALQIARAYEVGEHSGVLAMARLSFDISVFEIFTALLTGASLHLAGDEDRRSPERLQQLIAEQQVTVAELPPALMPLLDPDRLPSLRLVSVGGEAPSGSLVEPWTAGGRRFVNGYGPTETTVAVTLMDCEGAWEVPPPIGRPMANHRAAVLDAGLQEAGIGVPGELCIGGVGLARGYVGRPGLTADRFVPDERAAQPGERLYRTGDLARWLPDGTLEYLGRVDRQVKVRGHRVELGELEALLLRHPDVEQAVADVRRDEQGTQHLVAYVTGPRAPGLGELRRHLAALLPDTMLPTRAARLEQLPLTPSHKVDRHAMPLPPAEDGSGAAGRQPETEIERAIADEVVLPLLGIGRVGADDNFFELGGNSLQAIQVISRIRDLFQVEASLTDFFEEATVARLAQLVAAAVERPSEEARQLAAAVGVEPAAGAAGAAGAGEAPLAFPQEALWRRGEKEFRSAYINAPAEMRVRGELDVEAVRRSYEAMARRHGALRTRFEAAAGGGVQLVEPDLPPAFRLVDLTDLPPAEREATTRRLLGEGRRALFDVREGPPMRVQVLRLDERDHAVQWVVHHGVTDAWSTGLMVGELAPLYAAFRSGREPDLPPPPTQLADFARQQRAALSGAHLERRLRAAGERLTGLEVELDRVFDRRPAAGAPGFRPGYVNLLLPEPLANRVRDLARRAGTTVYVVLLSAYVALLRGEGAGPSLPIVTPVAGRGRSELERVVGMFVNRVVVRLDAAGDPGFGELLERARRASTEAVAHHEAPFEPLADWLADRGGAGAAVFPVMFSIQNAPLQVVPLAGTDGLERVEDDSGLIFTPVLELYSPARRRLDLSVVLREQEDGTISGGLEHNAERLSPEAATRLADRLVELVARVVERPESRLSELQGR